MARLLNIFGWWRRGGATTESEGEQNPVPAVALVEGQRRMGIDSALQISTVWACIELRANIIASLPFFAYQQQADGQKTLARMSRLYTLLHDSPNARMTPFEFWRAIIMNHDLRGNAYARIDRDPRTGEAISLWPMPADQVRQYVMQDGTVIYTYTLGDDVAVLAEENVLHLKGLGNGTVGLSKLDFMAASTNEVAQAQGSASQLFGKCGKPNGVLMVDQVLNDKQREAIRKNFGDVEAGGTGRLFVLEASMKYQQLALSPEDQQLLETRKFQIEDMCRWYGVPPILVFHSNVTAWGSGIEQIVDGFHKFIIGPLTVSIQQAVTKRVMTPRQRTTMTVEHSIDGLLRADAKSRIEIASKKVQNGLATRNEMRQLENEPPLPGGDVLTVQTNLLPIELLGKVKVNNGGGDAATKEPFAQ